MSQNATKGIFVLTYNVFAKMKTVQREIYGTKKRNPVAVVQAILVLRKKLAQEKVTLLPAR